MVDGKQKNACDGVQSLSGGRLRLDIDGMGQLSPSPGGFGCKTKRLRERHGVDKRSLVLCWALRVLLVTPRSRAQHGTCGRPPVAVKNPQRIHLLRQFLSLLRPAMEIAMFDMALFRCLAGAGLGEGNVPDESTVFRFRHPLDAHETDFQIPALVHVTLAKKGLQLRGCMLMGVTEIISISSAPNKISEHDFQAHPNRHLNRQHHAMKILHGLDADAGRTCVLSGRVAKVKVVTRDNARVQEVETDMFADVGHQNLEKHEETTAIPINSHKRTGLGEREGLNESTPLGAIPNKLVLAKPRSRAKPAYRFPRIKRPFGSVIVPC